MDWLKEWYQVIAGAVLVIFWQARLEYKVGEVERNCRQTHLNYEALNQAQHTAHEALNNTTFAHLFREISELRSAIDKSESRQNTHHQELMDLIKVAMRNKD